VLKDHPILVHYRNVYVITGGVIITIAAVVSLLFAYYLFAAMYPAQTTGRGWIWHIAVIHLCSLLFSKIFHFFAQGLDFFKNPKKYLSETAFYNQGGQIGVFVGTIWLSTSSGIDFFACMDLVLTAGCLALVIGRIGCYSYGCCHGRPISGRFGTVYTHPESKALRIFPEYLNVTLFPTQLVSAAFNLVLLATMIWMLSLSPKAGLVSAYFAISYNLFRLFIERYRVSVVNITARRVSAKLFQGTAVSLISSGLIYLAIVLLMPSPHVAFIAPLAPTAFFAGIVFDPYTLAALLFISVIYIATWGLHYGKLGQHFEWQRP